jgi:hypothetical protein
LTSRDGIIPSKRCSYIYIYMFTFSLSLSVSVCLSVCLSLSLSLARARALSLSVPELLEIRNKLCNEWVEDYENLTKKHRNHLNTRTKNIQSLNIQKKYIQKYTKLKYKIYKAYYYHLCSVSTASKRDIEFKNI